MSGYPVNVTNSVLPLPTGAATDASVQAITAAIQATINLSGSIWVDSTVSPPVYYVRKEIVNENTGAITISWETPGGVSATPIVTNLETISNAQQIVTETVTYTATGSGTGYTSGDILIHSFGIDTATTPPSIAYTIWFNAGPSVANGTILSSAPTGGTYSSVTGSTLVSNLPSTYPLDGAPGSGTSMFGGGTGSIGWLATIAKYVSNLSGTLPLPTNAAIETGGNLATVASAQGTNATGVTLPTGGSGVLGWLSGIYQKISGTLTVNTITGYALETGGNLAAILAKLNSSVAITQSTAANLQTSATQNGTWNVGITGTVPLPTGAATAANQPGIHADGGSLSHITNFPTTQAVSLSSLPALPTGTNTIGSVNAIQAGTWNATCTQSGGWTVGLNAGSAAIGTVGVTALPSIPAGSNNIGSVNVAGSVAVTGSFYQATQPISATSLPLPTGAATAAGQTAIVSAIQATINIDGTVWFDATSPTPVYYVRREVVNESTGTISIVWETPSGTNATPTVTNLQPISNAQNILTETVSYSATSSGTGYTSGDILIHSFGIDTSTSPPSIAYTMWMNAGPSVANGTILSSAPTGGTYSSVTQAVSIASMPTTPVTGTFWQSTQPVSAVSLPLPTGASQDGTDASGVTPPAGGTGIRGWLSGIHQTLTGTLSVNTITGYALETGGNLAAILAKLSAALTVTQSTPANLQATVTQGGTIFVYSANGSGTGTIGNSINYNGGIYQLSPGQTFTGLIEAIPNQVAISVESVADQPLLVTVYQYSDSAGVNLISTWVYNTYPGQPLNICRSVNGDYIQVTTVNKGTLSTTSLNQVVSYGSSMPVTSAGNMPTAIYEFSAAVSDSYGGSPYLHVDPSYAASDNSIYNALNVPQVGVIAASGTDGKVHALTSDSTGKLNVTASVINPVNSSDIAIQNATQLGDNPIGVTLIGSPDGNYAGLNILEETLNKDSYIGVNINQLNRPKVDNNDATVLSDIPSVNTAYLPIGGTLIIDTQGYNAVEFSTQTFVGTISYCNDQINWIAATGINLTTQGFSSTLNAANSFVYPSAGRYFKIVGTTAGNFTYILRNNTNLYQYANLIGIAGGVPATAGATGLLAVGGNVAVGSSTTAYPIRIAGADSGGLTRLLLTDTSGRQLPGVTDVLSATHAQISDVKGNISVSTPSISSGISRISQVNTNLLSVEDLSSVDGMPSIELLHAILTELRVLTYITSSAFGSSDDLVDLRNNFHNYPLINN